MTTRELSTGDLTAYGEKDDPVTVVRATVEELLRTLEPQPTDSTLVPADVVAGPAWTPRRRLRVAPLRAIGSRCRALAEPLAAAATHAVAPRSLRAVVDSDVPGEKLPTRGDRLT